MPLRLGVHPHREAPISRRRSPPPQTRSPLTVLANHFFRRGEGSCRGGWGGTKFFELLEEFSTGPQFLFGRDTGFEQGQDFCGNRAALAAGALAEGLAEVGGHVFDV
jgi:hypothetical protein